MSADRHHRNSINVRIGDFAPVFWIAARIKCLTLLDHVASWRSPEVGRAYIGERTSGIVIGEIEMARARQKRSEKERKTVGRSVRGRRGERERERERGSRAGKEGTRGA